LTEPILWSPLLAVNSEWGTVYLELLFDAAGLLAMLLAYLRPSEWKLPEARRKEAIRAAIQADRQYVIRRPWAKTVFLSAMIGFVIGGFLVTSAAIGNGQESVIHVGFTIQAIGVLVMAINQVIRGKAIRDAIRTRPSGNTTNL
jgi:hypothetical protein